MYGCDFFFRGESLGSHGYVLCSFDGSSSMSTVTTDSQKDFSSIAMFGGKHYPILYYTYGNALMMEMDIYKPSGDRADNISPAESAEIKRWLGCPTAQELTFCDDDYNEYHWNGTFNVEEVRAGGTIVGFHLTFQCTAPFGYKNLVTYNGTVEADGVVTINDTSDDEGYICPDVIITPSESGKLVITNGFDDRQTIINNCIAGEIITMTQRLQITSNNKTHEIADDFNWKFLRINNEYSNTTNELKFSLPCSYVISYYPVAKVVVA